MPDGDAKTSAARAAFASVDAFLQTEIEARALDFALTRRWLNKPLPATAALDSFARNEGMAPQAVALLLDILLAANVLERTAGAMRISPAFEQALNHRDLLEAKLWFANLVAPDVHQLFADLMTDIESFMAKARVFELFRYDLCLDVTPENLAATHRWVSYTTVLTKYESAGCHDRLDALKPRRMLDVGGNSGEFARKAVRRVAGLTADVFDLPVVCELGRRHLSTTDEAGRVGFIAGDLRNNELPSGYDLVSFKSMLHDWPDDYARAFLGKAVAALDRGGSLLIFERAEIRVGSTSLPYAMVANLVFLPFFRPGSSYQLWLEELGMVDIAKETVALDMPFHLITARKP